MARAVSRLSAVAASKVSTPGMIADGGLPNVGHFTGSDLATTSWDVLAGAVKLGKDVLVYDENGGTAALSCAEFAAAHGAKVTIATPDRALGVELGGTNLGAHMNELYRYGVSIRPDMALSLGKPVIFYCDHEMRHRFYRDIHPLSRLIDFQTGVAVGAMVTDSLDEVTELLYRVFENKMEYELEQPKPNYLRLREKLTGSVVRLQTNDPMLSETFWNHYHNR